MKTKTAVVGLALVGWVAAGTLLLHPREAEGPIIHLCVLKNQAFADKRCTPGGILRGATAREICMPGWSRSHRHVTERLREDVAASYGVSLNVPYREPGSFEIDHLIPLELGGSNAVSNLWPEPWPGNTVKDVAENALHRAVCDKTISLAFARAEMRRYSR